MSRIVQSKQVYNAGIHEFNTYGNGTLSSNLSGLNGIQTLSILNGNIGIGTNVPMSKLDVRGNIVCSNISVIGDFVTMNTVTSNTEQMVIENAGTGPALKVTQTGNNSVAEFYDKESGVALYVGNNGNVGIGTNNPQSALHVNGGIYASGTIIQTIYNQHYNNVAHVENNNGSINPSGISVTITPKSTTSKIMLTFCSFCSYVTANTSFQINILRNNTTGLQSTSLYNNPSATCYFPVSLTAFDTPNTTSPTSYQVYFGKASSPNRVILVHQQYIGYLIAQEIGA